MMDGTTTMSLALTVCLVGSSVTSFAFGILSSRGRKEKQLQNTIRELLKNPTNYYIARKRYLLNNSEGVDR